MGDFNSAAAQSIGEQLKQDVPAPTGSSPSQAQPPFHNQFYSQDQRQSLGSSGGQHGGFDMRPMLQALPQPGSFQGMHRSQYSNEGTNILSPASVYQMHRAVISQCRVQDNPVCLLNLKVNILAWTCTAIQWAPRSIPRLIRV